MFSRRAFDALPPSLSNLAILRYSPPILKIALIYGPRASVRHSRPFQELVSATWMTEVGPRLDAVLIFGGDGTIHRHLPSLHELKVPLLPVPNGSGNDFASSLGIHSPGYSLRAWRRFIRDRSNVRQIDLGRVTTLAAPSTNHLFCNVANLGLDADINRRANRLPAFIRSNGGYVFSLFPELIRYRAQPVTLTCLDENPPAPIQKPSTLVTFANGKRYGHGLQIAPRADMSDGFFDLCFVRRTSKLRIAALFPTVYFGRHLRLPEIEYFRFRRMRVETPSPVDIYADGEFLCCTPAEVSVIPAGLRVIIPEERNG